MGTFERFKELIFENNLNRIWTQYKKEIFKNNFYNEFTKEEIERYCKDINNIYSQRYRITKKLKTWKEMYFITLTFDNKNINKSKRTIYDKIRTIFNGTNFIATEDYGKNTQRLHYHILTDEDVNLENWKYGYTCKLKVNNKIQDKEKLSKYITKLANHNIKKGITKIFYGKRKKEKIISNT